MTFTERKQERTAHPISKEEQAKRSKLAQYPHDIAYFEKRIAYYTAQLEQRRAWLAENAE